MDAEFVMKRLVAAGLLLGAGLLCPPAHAGAFADACIAGGGDMANAKICACQEKLAESTLNPQELKAIIASASNKKADYVAAINAMTEDQANAFREKLRNLSEAVDSKCSQP